MLAKLKSGIEVPYEELWMDDNDLAEFIGKSFDQTQRLLRKMYKDRNYRKYIDKVAEIADKCGYTLTSLTNALLGYALENSELTAETKTVEVFKFTIGNEDFDNGNN
ncbi:TPA: hypothetical protein ACJPG9_001683 [Streptococcus pyogenes]